MTVSLFTVYKDTEDLISSLKGSIKVIIANILAKCAKYIHTTSFTTLVSNSGFDFRIRKTNMEMTN